VNRAISLLYEPSVTLAAWPALLGLCSERFVFVVRARRRGASYVLGALLGPIAMLSMRTHEYHFNPGPLGYAIPIGGLAIFTVSFVHIVRAVFTRRWHRVGTWGAIAAVCALAYAFAIVVLLAS
jgi:hypothetical protein